MKIIPEHTNPLKPRGKYQFNTLAKRKCDLLSKRGYKQGSDVLFPP